MLVERPSVSSVWIFLWSSSVIAPFNEIGFYFPSSLALTESARRGKPSFLLRLGPFPKGKSLALTLERWLSARGSGTYTVENGKAELDVSFEKLVPKGVYTVWCSRLTFPPDAKVIDRPCGAEDGSQNKFLADAAGKGKFKLTMNPLEPSSQETASVIALAYHSDGKTYGANPGDFGKNTHVQIVAMLPVPAATPPPPAPPPPPPAEAPGTGGLSGTSIALISIVGLIVLGLIIRFATRKPKVE